MSGFSALQTYIFLVFINIVRLSAPLYHLNISGDISDRFEGWWRHVVAGGCAGALSRTCTAPLDRLKVLLQVHGGRKQTSLLGTMRYMLNEGGVKGLWRGNGINVIKIAPESALKFGAYEEMKKVIKGDMKRELEIHERLMAGSFAGAFSQTVIYPLEVLKTRLALRKTGEFKGILNFAKEMFTAEGLKVFYKGYWPNLFGIIPYAGIDLAVYETLKGYCIEKYVEENTNPSALVLLGCGTLRDDFQTIYYFATRCMHAISIYQIKPQHIHWFDGLVQFLLWPAGGLPLRPGEDQTAESGGAGLQAPAAQGADPRPRPVHLHPEDRGGPGPLPGPAPQLLQSGPCCEHFLLRVREGPDQTRSGDELREEWQPDNLKLSRCDPSQPGSISYLHKYLLSN